MPEEVPGAPGSCYFPCSDAGCVGNGAFGGGLTRNEVAAGGSHHVLGALIDGEYLVPLRWYLRLLTVSGLLVSGLPGHEHHLRMLA